MTNQLLGILLVALGSAFFATAGLLVQFTEGQASSWVALCLGLTTGGAIVIPIALWRLGWKRSVAPLHRGVLSLRGFLSVAQVGTLFAALHSIPLTDAMLFRQTAPLWLPLFSAVILRERMPARFWPVIVVGFLGVGLVLHPHRDTLSVGFLFAAANGVLFALQTLITRRLDTLGEPLERILLYVYVIGFVTSLAPAWQSYVPLAPGPLVWLILAGLLMLCSTGCLVFAYGLAPAWLLAPIGYVAVVFAGLLDWLVYDQSPSPIAALGMGLVILSGSLILFLSARRSKTRRKEPR